MNALKNKRRAHKGAENEKYEEVTVHVDIVPD